ncbi:MAG: hypothetical protein WKF96_24890 [Solirubrobacteraceae bacterium]
MSRRRVERVRVVVYLDREDVERLDFIAANYHPGPVSRSHELREAVVWLIARRSDWMQRHREVAAHCQQLADDDAAALDRTRIRHPGRYDPT